MIRLPHNLTGLLAGSLVVAPLPAVSLSGAQRAPAAPDTVVLPEWDVPWGAAGRPRDPVVGTDGRIWFVGQEGNYVARLDPATGQFSRLGIDPGTNPHSINGDRAGNTWYTGGRPWFNLFGTNAATESTRVVPQHYVFFERERERIAERTFLDNHRIAGAQLKYTWRELEPERDQYRLQPLLDDLAFLEQHGKRLFIQLQDASFSEAVLVPDYLRTDPAFSGGAAREYEYDGDDESKAHFSGWVARRWDPAVRARFASVSLRA